jgi:hypothetical protein
MHVPVTSTDSLINQLAALRTELVDQAYTLERQGRLDAADVTLALSYRLAELCPTAAGDGLSDAIPRPA